MRALLIRWISRILIDPSLLWAATLGMRNGDDPDVETFKLVGATQQVRNLVDPTEPNPGTVKIALGAGNGATPGTIAPPPKNELEEVQSAYPGARRDFRLETDIDLVQGVGRARLRTPGHSWTQRTWKFDTANFPQITGIGFGQAFASGAGFGTVTATAFRIYSIDVWSQLGLLLVGLMSDQATLPRT